MPTRPNVLVVTCHDTGRHFGCYGVRTVHTPAIDALAAGGVRFTNYFTVCPLSSPSRGAMLTGRYPQSNGLMGLTHSPWDWSFGAGERHLSHLLRDAGYHTALFGRQHEASDPGTLGFCARHFLRNSQGQPCPADEVAAGLADFLHGEAKSRAPFYAQVGFKETHRPFDFGGVGPDETNGVYVPPYLAETDPTVRELAQFQGAVRQVNRAVEIIAGALAETGLDRDTIFVFTVDHGIPFPRAKAYLYDPGLAIALLVRWPGGGISEGRTCDWLLSNVDFLPTLLELIGERAPPNVQGHSFAAALRPGGGSPPRDAIFAMLQSSETRCIRTARYKLIRNFAPRRLLEVPVDLADPVQRVKCPVAQLFDLERDPNEFRNVAGDPGCADTYRELSGRLWAWLEQVHDPILAGPVPTPYYHESMAEYRPAQRQVDERPPA